MGKDKPPPAPPPTSTLEATEAQRKAIATQEALAAAQLEMTNLQLAALKKTKADADKVKADTQAAAATLAARTADETAVVDAAKVIDTKEADARIASGIMTARMRGRTGRSSLLSSGWGGFRRGGDLGAGG